MGCDIHLYTEVKINDTWHYTSSDRIDRDYTLFERMAGVRGDISNAVAEPKGIPEDMSPITRLEYNTWKLYAHSASWLSAPEIEAVYRHVDYEYVKPLFDIYKWHHFVEQTLSPFNIPEYERFPEEIQNIRFVFWFDN